MRAPTTYRDRIDHWQAWLSANPGASASHRQTVERIFGAYEATAACVSAGGCGARSGAYGPAEAETASQDPKPEVTTRAAVCRAGHPRTEENTYRRGAKTYCRPCRAAAARQRRTRRAS